MRRGAPDVTPSHLSGRALAALLRHLHSRGQRHIESILEVALDDQLPRLAKQPDVVLGRRPLTHRTSHFRVGRHVDPRTVLELSGLDFDSIWKIDVVETPIIVSARLIVAFAAEALNQMNRMADIVGMQGSTRARDGGGEIALQRMPIQSAIGALAGFETERVIEPFEVTRLPPVLRVPGSREKSPRLVGHDINVRGSGTLTAAICRAAS